LKNKYGNDLSNIKYVAFDMSLYDSTGTRKIENSDNLAVTVTLPIPDELVSYAGNNKAAAVINNQIDDKAVKFTTIDGVPCMTFTATHFSPYTVYVDLKNVTYGNIDTTPKTGMDIQPKWFLSLGLGFMSGVMFFWKDKKKVKKTSRA
ncbi:MAG: LPXTG cell wall anchor domain-containing protein, partial [Lachnospiraceae bacterium]|nr:LPXTG cell wall anchor domain-containing protein [Lachnospiraceae bacterium]